MGVKSRGSRYYGIGGWRRGVVGPVLKHMCFALSKEVHFKIGHLITCYNISNIKGNVAESPIFILS